MLLDTRYRRAFTVLGGDVLEVISEELLKVFKAFLSLMPINRILYGMEKREERDSNRIKKVIFIIRRIKNLKSIKENIAKNIYESQLKNEILKIFFFFYFWVFVIKVSNIFLKIKKEIFYENF